MCTKNFILVVCDPLINCYNKFNFQLLGKARSLSFENNSDVICICWGKDKEYAKELLAYGAHKVIMCDSSNYDYINCSNVVKGVIGEYPPNLVLFTGTRLGKAIASTVATSVGAGLVADCVEIKLKNRNNYIFSRAALSSSIIANIICLQDSMQMCTVKPNIFAQYVRKFETIQGSIQEINYSMISDFLDCVEVLESNEVENVENCDLERAKVIFAVGRGVSDGDFKEIKKLAIYYKAEIGGTRIMVERGKITKSRQIGQSGISVTPDLYIAFGISGANQHIAGIHNAKNIIAINNDENAAIFRYADYGIIADVHEVTKKLISKIR